MTRSLSISQRSRFPSSTEGSSSQLGQQQKASKHQQYNSTCRQKASLREESGPLPCAFLLLFISLDCLLTLGFASFLRRFAEIVFIPLRILIFYSYGSLGIPTLTLVCCFCWPRGGRCPEATAREPGTPRRSPCVLEELKAS